VTTYWRRKETGRVYPEDDMPQTGAEGKDDVYRDKHFEPVEVHPLGTDAELTRLRAIETRLRDDGTACVIHRVSTADAIDAYRLAVLGEEAT